MIAELSFDEIGAVGGGGSALDSFLTDVAAGAATGASFGFLAGGPVGALSGAITTVVVEIAFRS